jgi:predicted lactoylglutathione lyase
MIIFVSNVSLSVKEIKASRGFYEKLGFHTFAGDENAEPFESIR